MSAIIAAHKPVRPIQDLFSTFFPNSWGAAYTPVHFFFPLFPFNIAECRPPSVSSIVLCCFPVPGASLLPCYVILPYSARSSSWPIPSPWLPLCVAFGPPIVLYFCDMSSTSPLLFQCVFYNVNILFLISEHCILSCSFRPNISSPLLFERFSVCLSIVYWETVFGRHRSLLARHIGPLLVFRVKWAVVYLGVFPCFFPKQLKAALLLA